jgi:hypothetical protein
MNKERFFILYPALAGIVTDIIPVEIEDFCYEKQSIIDLLIEAVLRDPTIDDPEDELKIPQTFEWLTHPIIPISVDDNEWDRIKKEIIQKDKFLENMFQKNKLRRKDFGMLNLWFTLYPSLFSGNLEIEKEWDALYSETTPNTELATRLRAEGKKFLGTPSLYDLYSVDERVLMVTKMTILIKSILISYIKKQLEM